MPQHPKAPARVRAWYEGRVAEGHDWAGFPPDGVLGVRIDFTDGTARTMYGQDWYFMFTGPAGLAYGCCDGEPPDPARYPGIIALRGRWTDDATMRDTVDQINAG